ncbi:MAG: hypothetical protein Q4D34_05285, partial [Eggerthellaceae bacterium]|nr:hypothetical protein [Eggerthellaceae bacterium]
YRAVQDGALEFDCRRLQMKYRQLDEEHGFMAMYEAGRFEELQELFAEYIAGQCGSRMLGNKYYGGVYRYWHPKFVDLGDDLNWLVVELLSRAGRLHHPKRLLEACLFRNGKLSEKAQGQKALVAEMISMIDAFEQGRFEEVAERAAKGLEQKPDWINFIKLQILALQRAGKADPETIRNLVAAGKAVAPEDGDWLKYEGDTYVDEDPSRTEELYRAAKELTRNGSTLLGIDEYFAAKGIDAENAPALSDEAPEGGEAAIERIREEDLSDTERVHLQLLREIADICNGAGIRYFLSNRAALMAYALGGVTDGATSPTVLIPVEDSLKFAEAFKERQLPNRILDSLLTNNNYPTFSFRYVDTTTLCLSTRQLSNFVNHGMYVHIGFLEHTPPTVVRRFGSFLKTGWYDVNCVNARGSSVRLKSRFAKGAVGTAFNTDKDALVGSRLFHLLVKIYSGKSDSYQVNEASLKRVTFDADMIEGEQETCDVCGTTFTTFCDADDYLKRLFGRHYEKNAMKKRNLSVYRIVDPHISYDDYYRENSDLISDETFQQKIFENRFYNATNRKFMKVLDREWDTALYVDTKWELESRYEQEREQIDALYAAGQYEELADLLLPYISHFNKRHGGIEPFYDDHLLDVCEVFMYETKRYKRLYRMVKLREQMETPDEE